MAFSRRTRLPRLSRREKKGNCVPVPFSPGAGLGDWSVVWERPTQPGDTIVLHAGLYRPERLNYVDPMMAPFDGTQWLTLEGTPEKPITIRAAVEKGTGTQFPFFLTAEVAPGGSLS